MPSTVIETSVQLMVRFLRSIFLNFLEKCNFSLIICPGHPGVNCVPVIPKTYELHRSYWPKSGEGLWSNNPGTYDGTFAQVIALYWQKFRNFDKTFSIIIFFLRLSEALTMEIATIGSSGVVTLSQCPTTTRDSMLADSAKLGAQSRSAKNCIAWALQAVAPSLQFYFLKFQTYIPGKARF